MKTRTFTHACTQTHKHAYVSNCICAVLSSTSLNTLSKQGPQAYWTTGNSCIGPVGWDNPQSLLSSMFAIYEDYFREVTYANLFSSRDRWDTLASVDRLWRSGYVSEAMFKGLRDGNHWRWRWYQDCNWWRKFRETLRTMLTCAWLATQRQCETPLFLLSKVARRIYSSHA